MIDPTSKKPMTAKEHKRAAENYQLLADSHKEAAKDPKGWQDEVKARDARFADFLIEHIYGYVRLHKALTETLAAPQESTAADLIALLEKKFKPKAKPKKGKS